ncbi:HAMP domain-containing sensor histidine kinase [Spirillospora sp. NPDC047279]|uniref:sensor histidine kinase n=1 Tax=Spirillospora sp. NPDC047279 TaxID=3155478 RepID=UPI0033FD1DB0
MPVHRLRWPPSRWSLQGRVTAASIGIVGLLLVIGISIFYLSVRQAVYDGLYDRGTVAVEDLSDAVERADPHGPRVLTPAVPGFSLLQVVDDRGGVLAASPIMSGRPAMSPPRTSGAGAPFTRTVTVPGISGEVYLVGERVQSPSGWRTVLVGSSTAEFETHKGFFVTALLAVIAGTVLLVGWAVRRAVRGAMGPVRLMSTELASITGGGPVRRVSVPESDDEVAELARSINRTLRRLEGVVERQRGFVADVSHELRSPLTGLRAQLEVALEHPEDEDWPAVARAALGDADRLQRIVTDLLIMAKLEAGVRLEREPVDLGDLAHTEAARRRRRVPVEVEADEGVICEATRGHLVRLLTNLLDNAERHAVSQVWVTVRAEGGEAVMEVGDDGSGIPPGDRELVFLRFQRLAESRSRDKGGTGLGLPISREIAAAHGGTLEAVESERGALLVLRLPLKSEH